MTRTTIDGMTIWTKPIADIKRELQLRRRKLYEERHRRDRTQLVSTMLVLGFGLAAHAMFV